VTEGLGLLEVEEREHRESGSDARGRRLFDGLRTNLSVGRISGVYMGVVIIAVFSLWLPDVFPTVTTFQSVLSGQAVTGIAAVGLLFALAAGAYDLSVGYTMSVVGISTALLFDSGMNWGLAVLIGILIACAIGVVNGALVEFLGIDSFIATLATGALLQAAALGLSGARQITGFPKGFLHLSTASAGGVPLDFIFLIGLALVAWYILVHTSFGRRLYAIGYGREAARLAGVTVRRSSFFAFVLTAMYAGIAGVVLSGRIGVASPDIGSSYLIPIFAAALLGATQIHPGRPNVWGTLIATYLLATGTAGLQLAGGTTWVANVFNGVALIFAVGLAVFQRKVALWRRIRSRSKAVARSS
jgi:ribose transport system permease protein